MRDECFECHYIVVRWVVTIGNSVRTALGIEIVGTRKGSSNRQNYTILIGIHSVERDLNFGMVCWEKVRLY